MPEEQAPRVVSPGPALRSAKRWRSPGIALARHPDLRRLRVYVCDVRERRGRKGWSPWKKKQKQRMVCEQEIDQSWLT